MHLKVSRTSSVGAAVAVAVAIAIYFFVPEVNSSLHRLADSVVSSDPGQSIQAFRAYLLGFGAWAPVISASLMVLLQVFLLPIPTFFVTLTNGLLFGWALGAALSWSSSIVGAAVCYWIARSLGRPVVERLTGGAKGMEVLDLFFSRYGNRAVLFARLLPFLSFRVVSYGIGLTPVRIVSFLVATGIGQLPATLAYSYMGQNLTGSVKVLFWVLSITLAILVLSAMVGPAFIRRLRAKTPVTSLEEAQ
jgi:uncharacterized membrane protein YdjX (TVP38/TMEM64 family)